MMDTSVPYERGGRSRQKSRTRTTLVEAARDLLHEGILPTVEQAADRAGISRTTAYRYFPNQRELGVAAYPELDATTLLPASAPPDPRARLELVLDGVAKQILAYEPLLRSTLRLALETPKPVAKPDALAVRQGRALRWLEDALSPLAKRLGKPAVRRLALAIRATFGIEPFIWLVDVGGLSRRAAIELMRASARTLFDAATRCT